jgi:hypothetical protein
MDTYRQWIEVRGGAYPKKRIGSALTNGRSLVNGFL